MSADFKVILLFIVNIHDNALILSNEHLFKKSKRAFESRKVNAAYGWRNIKRNCSHFHEFGINPRAHSWCFVCLGHFQ